MLFPEQHIEKPKPRRDNFIQMEVQVIQMEVQDAQPGVEDRCSRTGGVKGGINRGFRHGGRTGGVKDGNSETSYYLFSPNYLVIP